MLPLIVIFLALILAVLVSLIFVMSELRVPVQNLSSEVKSLRLSGRTVQKQAVVRNQPIDEIRELTRLAAQSKSSRHVYGGEEESALYQDLSRGVGRGEDDDDD